MQARHRKIVIGLAVLVTVQALAIAIYMFVTRGRTTARDLPFSAEVLSARAAPPLAFEDGAGSTRTLADLRGKVVMVHFWATWCVPCRRELPGLLALAELHARTGNFELIAVSVDDDWEEIRSFFAGSIPLAIVRPDAQDVHLRFGASTLPDTYLVDAAGALVERYAGARDWTTGAARRHLAERIERYERAR